VTTLAEVAAAFGGSLRAGGLEAPLSSVRCFAQSLTEVGLTSPASVYWAGHCCFVRNPEDSTIYATVFNDYFGQATDEGAPTAPAPTSGGDDEGGPEGAPAGMPGPGEDGAGAGSHVVRYSALEVLRVKDFAECSADELREIERLMHSMLHFAPRRRSRRAATTRHGHGRPDLRKTVRAALPLGGETLRLHRSGPSVKERAVVLLVDVSGSMDAYSRAFLLFAHVAVSARRRVEVFTLGTRLTRVTRALAPHDPDDAMGRAAGAVEDFSGGTRLGEALRRFNDRFAIAGMARGAVVVIFSDGWDRGDPEQIGAQMARLDGVAHHVIWVNPLKAAPGYAPLARGMAAALPHVDHFLEGHSLSSLEHLSEVMAA
jgi:uncharacterized protein with von Willebrand factor type A (vWA) domain